MPHFGSCIGCKTDHTACAVLSRIKSALTGLGVSSVRHRCKSRDPIFAPGDAVWIETLTCYPSDDEHQPTRAWFPGTFIRQQKSKAFAFIAPKSMDEEEYHEFEPQNGSGFVKIPFSRVRTRSGQARVSVQVCGFCAGIPSLTGRCDGDPQYFDKAKCLYSAPTTQVETTEEWT